MEKTYSRINWENFPSVATPINDKNLNKIDEALNEVDNRVLGLDTAKLDKSTANSMVKDVTFDSETGVITIAYLNGSTKKIDTLLEKIIVNYRYDSATQKMILIMQDGTELPIDLSAFITPNEFVNSDTIAHTVDANGKVTSNVVDGSITEEKLEPNYLAKIKVETSSSLANKQAAESSATRSTEKALESESYAIGGTGTRNGENTDNAKYYSEQAKKHCENASVISGVGIATQTKAGLIKGGENHIAEDGTLTLTIETTEKTLENSCNGGIKVIEIGGKTEQKQYTGKNLYSGGDQSFTKFVDVTLEKELPPGTYTVSAVVTSTDTDHATCLVGFLGGSSDGGNANKTLARDKRSAVVVTISNPVKIIRFSASVGLDASEGDTATWKDIQIEAGDKATDYEPYVGGMSSPNPEYPQEIKKVVLSSAKSVGKNILDISKCSPIGGNDIVTVSGDDIIISAGSQKYGVRWLNPPLEVGKIYTFSCGGLSQHGSRKGFRFAYEDGTYSDFLGVSEVSVIVDKPVKQLSFYIGMGDTFTTDTVISKLQVELGDKVTEYKRHQESSITFTNPITLNGIGDAQDLIVRKDGMWGIARRLPEVDLGTLTWIRESNYWYSSGLRDSGVLVSNDVTWMSDSWIAYTVEGRSEGQIAFNSSGTLVCFTSDSVNKPTGKLIYAVTDNNVTFEPLPTADQIALNSLLSFDGVTYLHFDSEIQPTSLVEYGTSHVGALTLEAWNKAENNRIRVEEILTRTTE